jgi:AcrR family transcriptional regulator
MTTPARPKSAKPAKSATGKTRTVGKGHRFNDTELILRSARACFERFGVEKTRLEDIAREAGISRPLLYKLFNGRQVLTDAVINAELHKLIAQQALRMQKCSTFRQVLIEGTVTGIELARADKVLMDLLLQSSVDHLPNLLLDHSQPAHSVTLSLWQGYFEQARARGELSPGMSDDDLMEWLMSLQYLFVLREEVSLDRIRELLELFVCPILSQT